MRVTKLVLCLFMGSFLLCQGQEMDLSQFESMEWRNIGPAGMSGRITAIDVNLQDKDHIIVGSASGGVWESKNGGISWKPIFDDQPTLAIGSVKFNPDNPAEIWVGTGEGNPRNSHNSGAGIFKSIDGGKTWKYSGLKDTKLIHRIIIHADNSDIIYAGALGSAWGPSEERGVFRTKDGGVTWEKILYTSTSSGVADMVVDPSNPNKLLVAMWEFGRTPWGFNSGGPNSGLYLTYDGGDNWKKITDKEGLPEGNLGRIGLSFSRSKPNIVYALVESEKNGLYRSDDGGEKWKLISSKDIGNRPFYYSEIYVDPLNENRIYNLWSYVSVSEDGGRTFTTIMDYGNNVHPDHHAFWIDPEDSNYLINGNDGGLNISRDGAATWQFIGNLPVGQFYHVNVDDEFPYNVYGGMQDNGSWVGPGFVLKNGGIRNYDWQELYFGDGFDVAPKPNDARYGYAMSQEGNIAYYDRVTGRTHFIQPQHPDGVKLRYNWNAALAIDPFEDCGLYYGSQFVHKSMDCGNSWAIISPDLTTNDTIKQNQSKSGGLTLDITGAENHTTILAIAPSAFDKNLIFASTDDGHLQRTRDGGATWENLSAKLPGLPKNAWLPQIKLSEINENELFVVANNYRQNDWSAYLYHSLDGGETWKRLVDDSAVGGFVCSILQDSEVENLLFLGTDVGLYFSLNYGKTWTKWDKQLPPVQIRDMVIQKTFDDLVLGTFGRAFWILDDITPLRELATQGLALLEKDFHAFPSNDVFLTSYRSYDGIRFVAQGEFVGGNKNSSAIFSLWNKPQKSQATNEDKDKEVQDLKAGKKDKKSKKEKTADKEKDTSTAKKKVDKKKPSKVDICVINERGDTVRTFKRNVKEGLNRISWRPDQKGVEFPSKFDPKEKSEPGGMPIIPGTYKVVFSFGDSKDSTMINIKLDPRESEFNFDAEAKYVAMQSFNKNIEMATKAFDNLKEAKKLLDTYGKLIEVQEDTIKKEMGKQSKSIESKIDSLMNLYMLPESKKTEYRDESNTLNSLLSNANRFLRTSTGAPTGNGMHAVRVAESRTKEVVGLINEFFTVEWKAYNDKIKALPINIFKDFIEIKLE